ncbi:NAD-dependent protein deacetylase [Paenibacillus auburnensis]|uniref:NAD-dependent protein deacetylase n=1 Tax=Paenibacillus auburnensis TaxID=2905649 RepID=A0ABM9C8L2_9BACL|nr:NAD-dependent protein deacylase [Paenibacillus auburnensis]CAH1205666.1 NAD-dependent protein deacetylase [Paenibacillus auburnensis]
MDQLQTLVSWIKDSGNIVFFGGAGTSTESGIPDFRSAAGLYQTEHNSPYPPEVMLSRRFFMSSPDVFFDFYRSKMIHPEAPPNGAHLLLAELERQGRLKAVITQNIDGLHQLAGSRTVLELHGSIHRNHCMSCSRFYDLDQIIGSAERVPRCPECGGIIKPDVVLYEEELNHDVLLGSIAAIAAADLLIIGGTSLTVQPAASLVTYFHGRHTVLLNGEPTPYDHHADLIITDRIGEVMGRIQEQL